MKRDSDRWRASHEKRKRDYKERRKSLVARLGGRCEVCQRKDKLEFDHHSGRDWDIHGKNAYTRMGIYEAEADQGLIRLLCTTCNNSIRPNSLAAVAFAELRK